MTGDAAIAAARQGWAVFPCRPGGKPPAFPGHGENRCDGSDPRCRNGHTGWEPRATTDEDRIRRAWRQARWNIGIACGPSRLVVLDLDAHGKLPDEWQFPGVRTGRDVLAQICEWAGMPWPATHTVATPSGGQHLYFTAPEGINVRNSASLIGPQVDVRGHGGYVLGAGSSVNGRTYEALDDDPPAPLPAWITRLLTRDRTAPNIPSAHARRPLPGKRLAGLAGAVSSSQPGNRTGTLVWAAFRLKEMIASHDASPDDAQILVEAAVRAGIDGGERYAQSQVRHVLGGAS